MCPSCEQHPIALGEGVCSACAAMYSQSLGPDWRQTEIGQFLMASNQKTEQMNERIACTPTGYELENVAVPTEEIAVNTPKNVTVDEMIGALVTKHQWGYRRIHAFLQVGGFDPPSLATVKRRARAMRGGLGSETRGSAPGSL